MERGDEDVDSIGELSCLSILFLLLPDFHRINLM